MTDYLPVQRGHAILADVTKQTPSASDWLKHLLIDPALLNRKLQDEDIPSIYQSLERASTNWFIIGLNFKIPKHRLNALDPDKTKDTPTILMEVIIIWIGISEHCTWRMLLVTLHELHDTAAEQSAITSIECTEQLESIRNDNQDRSTRMQKYKQQEKYAKSEVNGHVRNLIILHCRSPNVSSTDSILDNIDQHLQGNQNLTPDQVEEVVRLFQIHAEEFCKRHNILQEWADELMKNLESNKKFQKNVDEKKKSIKECLDKEEIVQIAKADKLKSVFEQCDEDLKLLNTDYKTLSDYLSDCQEKVQLAIKEIEQTEKLQKSYETSYGSGYRIAAGTVAGIATGSGGGGVLGLLLGPAGATIGAGVGALFGGMVGAIGGLLWAKSHEETYEKARKSIQTLKKYCDEYKKILELLDKKITEVLDIRKQQ